ncbi:MAG: AAA family ATPase [Myxococcaceae bacterium]
MGQGRLKDAIIRLARSQRRPFGPEPSNLLIAGPPGVGKTELAHGLAHALHGDRTKVVIVDFSKVLRKEDLNDIFGSNRSYVGFEADEKTSSLAPSKIQEMFGGKGPAIVLWDEFEKGADRLGSCGLCQLG